MKFLIQIPQLIFGGAEKVLVSFANELAAHGHDVTILETYEKGYLKPQFDSRVRFDAICSKAYTEKYYLFAFLLLKSFSILRFQSAAMGAPARIQLTVSLTTS